MTVIEKYLGHRVTLPDNLRYYVKQGLWARLAGSAITCGFSEPALALSGGIQDLDFLTEDGDTVEQGQSVLFAITGKILYIDSPVQGIIVYNAKIKTDPVEISQDPYGKGWLFSVTPALAASQAYQDLADCAAYLESLQGSEGFKNPEGLKGGVSGVCKAVYSGIRMQKIHS
jgi:glycine cleavage system H lipoate-binding protein